MDELCFKQQQQRTTHNGKNRIAHTVLYSNAVYKHYSYILTNNLINRITYHWDISVNFSAEVMFTRKICGIGNYRVEWNTLRVCSTYEHKISVKSHPERCDLPTIKLKDTNSGKVSVETSQPCWHWCTWPAPDSATAFQSLSPRRTEAQRKEPGWNRANNKETYFTF